MFISRKIIAINLIFWFFNSSYGSNLDDFLKAIKDGDTQLVQDIIKGGFDIHQRDKEDNTPLHYAAANKSKEIVRILVGHGADVNAVNKYKSKPLKFAIRYGNTIAAKLLLALGTEYDIPDVDGFTSLHDAACAGNICLVRLLALCGADVNAVNKFNENALQIARKRGYKKCANELESIIYEVAEMSEDQRKKLCEKALADVYAFLGIKK